MSNNTLLKVVRGTVANLTIGGLCWLLTPHDDMWLWVQAWFLFNVLWATTTRTLASTA